MLCHISYMTYHFRIGERSRQIMSLVMMDSVGFFGCYQNLYISVVPFSKTTRPELCLTCLGLMFLSSLLEDVLFVCSTFRPSTHHSNLRS